VLRGLTPRLTGAGARSAEGTNTGHENAEGMASVGVRVEPPVSTGQYLYLYQINYTEVRWNMTVSCGGAIKSVNMVKVISSTIQAGSIISCALVVVCSSAETVSVPFTAAAHTYLRERLCSSQNMPSRLYIEFESQITQPFGGMISSTLTPMSSKRQLLRWGIQDITVPLGTP